MKVIFFTYSGHAYVDDCNPTAKFIELQDGLHPVTASCVFKDVDHRNDAIMVVQQGVTAPEGDEYVRPLVYEADRMKTFDRRPRCDRLWFRRMCDFFINTIYVSVAAVTFIAVYLVLWVLIYVWFGKVLPI